MLEAIALTRREFGLHPRMVADLHRLRARVFKDRLNWDVTVSGGMEIDTFDAEDPTYLLIVANGLEVVGHVRFLSTLGPNMLADIFPGLLDGGEAPCSPWIVESSRFCVDTGRTGNLAEVGLRQATFMLFSAMLEWSLDHGQRAIATVTDTRMERILRRAGWPLQRLGTPRLMGATQAVGGLLPVSADVLAAVQEAGGLAARVLASREPLCVAA